MAWEGLGEGEGETIPDLRLGCNGHTGDCAISGSTLYP